MQHVLQQGGGDTLGLVRRVHRTLQHLQLPSHQPAHDVAQGLVRGCVSRHSSARQGCVVQLGSDVGRTPARRELPALLLDAREPGDVGSSDGPDAVAAAAAAAVQWCEEATTLLLCEVCHPGSSTHGTLGLLHLWCWALQHGVVVGSDASGCAQDVSCLDNFTPAVGKPRQGSTKEQNRLDERFR